MYLPFIIVLTVVFLVALVLMGISFERYARRSEKMPTQKELKREARQKEIMELRRKKAEKKEKAEKTEKSEKSEKSTRSKYEEKDVQQLLVTSGDKQFSDRVYKITEYFRYNRYLYKKKDEIAALDYIEKHGFAIFPHKTKIIYDHSQIKVFRDEGPHPYVLHDGKKMFYPSSFDDASIQMSYNSLLREQDADSPHRYTTHSFKPQEGDILFDVGASEGMFALSHIESLSKVYLFECEGSWIEALKKTFKPWIEKIEIVNKFIGAKTVGTYTTLDDFCKEFYNDDKENSYFVKADIEGAELDLLSGAKNILQNKNNVRMILCTYHRHNDAQKIEQILVQNNFKTEFSKGYMVFLFADDELKPPYLRRGVIRAEKGLQS
ncbi:MAG: hypothetical protein Ta2G_15290 [Termitinemataceae bacterium]|nr:MAG: hypothetical protein Ta2G_15290 [Termitinemataceae bacterium]